MSTSKPLFAITLDQLNGIGQKRYEALCEKGLSTVEDLLRFYPRKYLDRRKLDTVNTAVEDKETAIKATLDHIRREGKGKKERLVAYFKDENGDVFTGVWFRGFGVKYPLQKAGTVILVGKPSRWKHLSFAHPDFYKVGDESLEFGRIVPVYSSSQTLKNVGLSQKIFRKTIYKVCQTLGSVEEFVPQNAKGRPQIKRKQALQQIHFPQSFQHLEKAKQYLKYEELYTLQAFIQQSKKKETKAPVLSVPDVFKNKLPFTLTDAQSRAISDIKKDMTSGSQMNRLVQGDVGAGKTVVAVAAVLAAAKNGYQAAFMAPTEILAEQHYRSLSNYLKPYGITPTLLTASQSNKKNTRKRIANGKTSVVVGTHALLTKDTAFHKLGLAVIDEQHRFGVRQRQELFESAPNVHMLLTTATPIPRSYAQTFYGDLDVSTIDEMPSGRKPVETYWPRNKKEAYDVIFDAVTNGAKAFVVCPMIEEDEDLVSVEQKTEEIVRRVGANGYNLRPVGAPGSPSPGGDGVEVFVAHGQMKPEEKQAALSGFEKASESAVLISTTVVEVGIDVPDATIMLIEDANQFGLSQLHQLRGRVGRSDKQSYCFLITQPQKSLNEKAVQRMQAMIETTDGFKISERDMQIRGTGSIVSEAQSGHGGFCLADLRKDQDLAQDAYNAAQNVALESAAQVAKRWFKADTTLSHVA